jgi:signal transduction histidine kinase
VITPTDKNRILFKVTDEGYGIPAEELPHIAEKFCRGRDAEGRQVPGLGLGLYVTRRILRAHGTDLTLESSLGKGTTASFELEMLR